MEHEANTSTAVAEGVGLEGCRLVHEVEARFRVADPSLLARLPDLLRRLGGAVSAFRRGDVHDVYLDTERGWLHQAGVACRLRTADDTTTLELKTLTPAVEGVARRLECAEEVREAPRFPGPLPDGPLGRWLTSLMPAPTVRVQFELRQHRAACDVNGPDGLHVIASADELTYGSGQVFREIELELREGDPAALHHLSQALVAVAGVEPEDESKFARGLRLAGIPAPTFTPPVDGPVSDEARFVDAAYRLMRRQWAAARRNEPGARLGLEPEFLHDMRVAVRRLRSLLRVFREALPARRVAALRRDLRWLGTALGEVRDLDVYLERVRDTASHLGADFESARGFYERQLAEQRHRAREAMLRLLGSRRYARFLERFARFLDHGPARRPAAAAARRRVGDIVPGRIREQLKAVLLGGRALTPASPDAELHAQRIRCKRLRYLLEFFADVYGKPLATMAARVHALQNVLGAQHDAVVAIATIKRFAPTVRVRGKAGLWVHLMLGQMLALEARRADEARAGFFRQWSEFDSKKTRRGLRKRLAKAKPTV